MFPLLTGDELRLTVTRLPKLFVWNRHFIEVCAFLSISDEQLVWVDTKVFFILVDTPKFSSILTTHIASLLILSLLFSHITLLFDWGRMHEAPIVISDTSGTIPLALLYR